MNHPSYVVPDENLIPVSDDPKRTAPIPPSRMFLINKSLKVYQEKNPGGIVYDASQGDGGASLPGVSLTILDRAQEYQKEHGTAYDMPYGTDRFRRSVIEDYWKIDSNSGIGPGNVLATVGGRDALVKAYEAMLALGHGRRGDAVIVTRVPWISYSWGPYGIGANVLLAPGDPASGWSYTPESIRECVAFAEKTGRKIAGLILTNPDNPTGRTITPGQQAELGKVAIEAGVAFVLYDWMYHYVTDESPMNLNEFLQLFSPDERIRLMFLDGITKSLGASNIRNCHLIASESVIKYIVARASHGVIPDFYSQAVAMAAYEFGYAEAAKAIIEPTNASRLVLKNYLDAHAYTYILGKGYYAFINVSDWIAKKGWEDTEPLGQYLAEEHGIAIVPGVYFSKYGGGWIRFSYATPVDRTEGALERLTQGLTALSEQG